MITEPVREWIKHVLCWLLLFFFFMRKPKKDGHIVLCCPFLSEQKEGGNAESQKSWALRMRARVLFATSFNRLPKAATSSVLGDAHPHGPNNLRTQICYSPAAVPCLPGALHLSQSPGYWTSTVWSPLISQPALPDSESSLLALRWCLLIPASLFPALYIRVLPTKADYDREMQDTFSNHQRHYVSIWMHTFVKNWHTILLTMNQSWLGKTRWATSKLVSLWQTDTMKRVLVLLQRKVKERNEFFFPFSWEQRR